MYAFIRLNLYPFPIILNPFLHIRMSRLINIHHQQSYIIFQIQKKEKYCWISFPDALRLFKKKSEKKCWYLIRNKIVCVYWISPYIKSIHSSIHLLNLYIICSVRIHSYLKRSVDYAMSLYYYWQYGVSTERSMARNICFVSYLGHSFKIF